LRATARLPLASVRQTLPGLRLVAGGNAIPWPTGVQSALTIGALGVSLSSGQETAVPVASLTKMMTARIILTDHPLASGQDGPTVTITPDAVTLYQEDLDTGQANVEVAVGEVLTERQLLEGMLVHSANNFADLLAIWDAGSVSAFVTKMNAAAAALGMSDTTYSDASGLSTQTMSTPVDQLKLAQADVTNPVFDQIVDNSTVTLPIAGTVGSFTPLIGFGGVVGIKSGFTSAAGGCDVLAMTQLIAGRPVEVLVAVVGVQTGDDVVSLAGLEALAIARAAVADVRLVHVARPGQEVAVATLAGHSIPVVARSDASVLAWPGQRLSETLEILSPPPAGAPAGWRIGVVTAQVGPQSLQFTAGTATLLPTPSFFQRIF
jgi:D-alanyl-D-alanine carboxypeptidase (penicillin-binding protein 5/6)